VRQLLRLLAIVLVVSVAPVLSGPEFASASTVTTCTSARTTLSAIPTRAIYAQGAPVYITVALRNRTHVACTFALGPTSPNYALVNASGTKVWGSCWSGGGPVPCPLYLRERVLAPEATFRERLTWNQRSGKPDPPVPAGRYRFTATLSGIALRAVTAFSVTTS
jgi:hypothetical protein